jgi:hypothetical protein
MEEEEIVEIDDFDAADFEDDEDKAEAQRQQAQDIADRAAARKSQKEEEDLEKEYVGDLRKRAQSEVDEEEMQTPLEKGGRASKTDLRAIFGVKICLQEVVQKHRVRVVDDKIYVDRGGSSVLSWIRSHAVGLEKRATKLKWASYADRFDRDVEASFINAEEVPSFQEEQIRLGRDRDFVRKTLLLLPPGTPGPSLKVDLKSLPSGWDETLKHHLAGEISATNPEVRKEKRDTQQALTAEYGDDMRHAKRVIKRASAEAKVQAEKGEQKGEQQGKGKTQPNPKGSGKASGSQ